MLFSALDGLGDENLSRNVLIRGVPLTVAEALHRSLARASVHVGQTVFLARSLRGDAWTFLSIRLGVRRTTTRTPCSRSRPRRRHDLTTRTCGRRRCVRGYAHRGRRAAGGESTAFLQFVERRVGDRAVVEEVLQDAFVRGTERADSGRDRESAVAWFFRVLRSAIVDHRRRATSAVGRARELSVEPQDSAADTAEACRCILKLAETLKPDYADALRRVDVESVSVAAFAAETGISANNASERLSRARDALKKRVEATVGPARGTDASIAPVRCQRSRV